MLRSDLGGERVTVWQELHAIICCERSRSYLNSLLIKYDEKEKEYQEKKRKEEEEEEMEKLNKGGSYREQTPAKKDRDDHSPQSALLPK